MIQRGVRPSATIFIVNIFEGWSGNNSFLTGIVILKIIKPEKILDI